MPPVKQTIVEPEYTMPLAERIIQSEESRLLRSGMGGFDYDAMSQKYPLADVRRATAPRYIQRELDEEDVMMNIRELEAAKRQADLQLQDSIVKQNREMYRQIPAARVAISQLDPTSDDFLNQLIGLQSDTPLAYENPDFQKMVVDPLVRRHERFQSERLKQKPEQEALISESSFQDAASLLSDNDFQKKVRKGDPISIARAEVARDTMNAFLQQRGKAGVQPVQPTGFPSESPSATPTPQGAGQRVPLSDIFK
jgi:hypothetical protein